MKQAFDILDVDKDGEISTDELKQAFAYGNMGAGMNRTQAVGANDELWDKLLGEIDSDGDGKINYQEFHDHMMILIDKGHYTTRDNMKAQLANLSQANDL